PYDARFGVDKMEYAYGEKPTEDEVCNYDPDMVGVASKNDPGLVKQALQRKDLIVAADSLFPIEAHWEAKSGSVENILRAWNVGADSVVFIDDSRMELAEVATAFPEIEGLVFPTGDDHALPAFLEKLRDLFGKSSVTEEDRLRVSSLRASQHRAGAAAATTADAFLAQAEAEISIICDKPDQRTFELINKTNQFNLNGRRLDEAAWKARVEDSGQFLISASYTDKFGPLGKIAVVSGRYDSTRPLVDVWVLSCRAFSRRIEHRLLKLLFDRLDAESIWLDFIPTDRNGPLCDFIETIADGKLENPTLVTRKSFLANCPRLSAKVNVE
ncbi:hypothetical protein LCGC14_2467070, partial [marine sediment metagenome]